MTKKKSGTVYFLESTRKDGSKKMYTGITRRPVRTRLKEHFSAIKSDKSKTWVGRGTKAKARGAFISRNPEKAERTIKKLTPHQKRYLARGAAMKYNKK